MGGVGNKTQTPTHTQIDVYPRTCFTLILYALDERFKCVGLINLRLAIVSTEPGELCVGQHLNIVFTKRFSRIPIPSSHQVYIFSRQTNGNISQLTPQNRNVSNSMSPPQAMDEWSCKGSFPNPWTVGIDCARSSSKRLTLMNLD